MTLFRSQWAWRTSEASRFHTLPRALVRLECLMANQYQFSAPPHVYDAHRLVGPWNQYLLLVRWRLEPPADFQSPANMICDRRFVQSFPP
jgi:hypothetical protein